MNVANRRVTGQYFRPRVTCVRLVGLIVACSALQTACGSKPFEPKIDLSDVNLTADDAREIAELAQRRVGSRELQYAPEMIAAGEYLLARAGSEREREALTAAKSTLAEAEQMFAHAIDAADTIANGRRLQFARDRSVGTLHTRAWNDTRWTLLGEAQGTVEVPPEQMVQLSADESFTANDIDMLVANGPGAIQFLDIGDNPNLKEILPRLRELNGLRDLTLYRAGITDEEVPDIAALITLRQLNLISNRITSDGVKWLGDMPALEELALGDTDIDDRAVFYLRNLPRLKKLLFRNVEISDVGVDYLSSLETLEVLWVSGYRVTDYSLPILEEMSSLKEVVFLFTSVTDRGTRRLKKALPGSKVDRVI